MKTRDTNHYLEMFRSADTVGFSLVADALHVARGGQGKAPSDFARAVKRMHGDVVSGAVAAMLVADEATRTTIGAGFGARLKAVRAERKLTQADLAELAGLGRRAIQYLEQDEREPSLSTLRSLAGALRVSVGELVGDDIDDEIRFLRDPSRPVEDALTWGRYVLERLESEADDPAFARTSADVERYRVALEDFEATARGRHEGA